MKLNIHHLYHLFRKAHSVVISKLYYLEKLVPLLRSGWIIIALLLFSAITLAQESTPEEFILGSMFDGEKIHKREYYDTFRESGMNYLSQYADDSTHGLLQGLNFSAYNSLYPYEWIYYYSTAYYSKWEAEENQIDTLKVGFKHIVRRGNNIDTVGSPATFLGRQCWSTEGLTEAADSLLYGPHYHQEKVYKRWYVGQPDSLRYNVRYTPRYYMALHLNDEKIDPEEVVCRLYVRESYRNQIDGEVKCCTRHWPLKEITLYVSDFAPYDTFKVFYLHTNPDSVWYKYPEKFQDPHDGSNKRENLQTQDTLYFDRWGGQGVQFCIDWLRNDTKCDLYIDNIELYDNDGGQDFADNPDSVTSKVVNYAQQFPKQEWSNMKYWGGCDEPGSLDDYTPLKTVDSILDSIGAPRLITTFYPWWEVEVNGDTQLVRYYNTVQPEKLIIDFFPFLSWRDPVSFDDWEYTRKMLQICSSLQPGFWYQAQAGGKQENGEWSVWRRPDTSEFKAQTMLALSHGVKGILYWLYTSFGDANWSLQGIIDLYGQKTDLWYVIYDNIAPRLKGKLGNTLLDLNYTGNYLQLQYSTPTQIQPVNYDYLTLGLGQSADDMNWHCGCFDRTGYLEDKYFMLTNLITTEEKNINVKVQTPGSSPVNYRFRNIEGLFDTTVQAPNYLIKVLNYPPGEGYLYEFAPVVKYGGRLLYDETISSTTTLLDDMTIEDDAVLTVNNTYNVGRSITIKDGGNIVTTNGGTLKFYNDVSLIIEGAVTISGTSENPLVLDFINPADSNGIIIRPGASLTISYCQIMNAATGIFSELNANYINVQYIDFVDCGYNSISILGQDGDMEPTPVPLISSCSMTNSDYGISVSNLSSIIISYNTIINTDCGIMLSNVSDAQIISNTIQSNTEVYPGIWYFSSGGVTRENQISDHSSACFLANSSPKLGKNTMTSNKYHGIYVGSGSNPYMQGEYAGSPPNMYVVSGYNEIYENGGY